MPNKNHNCLRFIKTRHIIEVMENPIVTGIKNSHWDDDNQDWITTTRKVFDMKIVDGVDLVTINSRDFEISYNPDGCIVVDLDTGKSWKIDLVMGFSGYEFEGKAVLYRLCDQTHPVCEVPVFGQDNIGYDCYAKYETTGKTPEIATLKMFVLWDMVD